MGSSRAYWSDLAAAAKLCVGDDGERAKTCTNTRPTSTRLTKKSSPTRFPTRHWKLPRARRGGLTRRGGLGHCGNPAAASASDGPLPMTDDNNTAIDAIQIDEDILTYTVSDEALEAAAAGSVKGADSWLVASP